MTSAPLLPSCPLCHALIGQKGHTCRTRRPNWGTAAKVEEPPITDPAEVRARLEECRAALASTSPPAPRPAGDLDLYRVRPFV